LSDVGGSSIAAAMSGGDRNAAWLILTQLAATQPVLAAGIYDRNGFLLASDHRPGGEDSLPASLSGSASRHDRDVLLLVRPLQHGGTIMGSLCLVGDTRGEVPHVLRNLVSIVVALFICLGASMLVLLRFLGATVEPILSLTRTARSVTKNQTYAMRAAPGPNDEVGELVAAFNGMLTQIESRDLELERHRNNLEDLVEERTRELVSAKDRAEEAVRLKSQFLANMSHEIRTPLNGVLGVTHLVLDTQLDSVQKELVETIKISGETLLALINDILDFSKIEAGQMSVESIPISPSAVMQASVKTLAWSAAEKGLFLSSHVDPSVPERILADPLRLKQILLNLLGNALKFTSAGTITVSVAPRNGFLRFSIEDTGIGIAPTQIKAIFEPFRQADGSTTRKYGGSGLGLSICTRLVELMGGEIGVQSEVGKGSCFWFTVPARVVDVSEPEPLPLPDIPARLSLRILLAEDNTVNQRVATRLLEKMGHQVRVASNGSEAVHLYLAKEFDLILMDVQMPVMGGYEATAAIREREHESGTHIPIVALTAHAVAGDRERCLEAGMDDYVSKPIRQEELAAAIRRAQDKSIPSFLSSSA
jgi:signal transduction histidine kinase/ActR/RegA family two-component response regulator